MSPAIRPGRAIVLALVLILLGMLRPAGACVLLGQRSALEVILWDVETGKARRTLFRQEKTDGAQPFRGGCFSADGSLFGMRQGFNGPWRVWDTRTGTEQSPTAAIQQGWRTPADDFVWDRQVLPVIPDPNGRAGFTHAATLGTASPDCQSVAVNYQYAPVDGSKVKVWNLAASQFSAVFTHSQHTINAMQWSPSGKYIAASGFSYRQAGGSVGRVEVWDRASAQRVLSVPAFGPLKFSPTGEQLAMLDGEQGATVLLCDTTTWKVRALEHGHDAPRRRYWAWPANGIVFSADGRRLATSGRQGKNRTVKVWDVASLREIAAVQGHDWPVTWLELSADGKLLVTGSGFSTTVVDRGRGPEEDLPSGDTEEAFWDDAPIPPWNIVLATAGAIGIAWLLVSNWRKHRVAQRIAIGGIH